MYFCTVKLRYCFIAFIFINVINAKAQSLNLSKSFLYIGDNKITEPSTLDSLNLTFTNFSNNLLLVTNYPFEMSLDGISFNDSLSIPLTQSGVNQQIILRINALQNNIVFRQSIKFYDGNIPINKKVYLMASSIDGSNSLKIVNWNMRYFGSPSNCACDTALAVSNAKSIINELKADVYAIEEMVSIPELQHLAASLGQNYHYLLADYCSLIDNDALPGYQSCQKQAFIYNAEKITSKGLYPLAKSTYPAQQNSSSPYWFFASGRWPSVFKAEINSTVNQETFFITNIHAKAYATADDHNRRASASLVMADTFNTYFPNEKIIIVGDYNDLLEGAITSGFTVSPYQYMFNNGFIGLSLPSLYPGEYTYIGSTNSLIDNLVVNNTALNSYIPNSFTILHEADYSIPNFKNTTSDHLPVLSFFKTNTSIGTENVIKNTKKFVLLNPSNKELHLKIPEDFVNKEMNIKLLSMDGRVIISEKIISNQAIWKKEFSQISSGMYFVLIQGKNISESHTWITE